MTKTTDTTPELEDLVLKINIIFDLYERRMVDPISRDSELLKMLKTNSLQLLEEIEREVLGSSAAGILDEYNPILDRYLDKLRSKLSQIITRIKER